MQYNIESQVCSFCVLLIFAVVFFSKSRLKNVQNQIYGILLIQSLLTIFFDVGSVIAINNHTIAGNLTPFFAKGYLCMMIIWITTMSIYAISLVPVERIFEQTPKLGRACVAAVFVVVIAICSFIILEDTCYYSKGGKTYTYGASTDIVYFYAFVSIFFCFLLVILNKKNIPVLKRMSTYMYFGMILTVGLIQRFHPTVLLVSSGGALSIVFMYFTLENPDVALIEELNEARLEADRANQAKANFLTNMSHEIRTPINAVIGMNEMILREHPGKEIENYAKQIEWAGHNLLDIINDILDFSKIESGKMDIVPTKYLMYSMLQEIYSIGKVSADKKKLEFKVLADPEFPRILYGDEIRIKQIIMNLMSNAIKYTQRGKVTISFAYKRIHESKIDLIIKVIDTGQGIKEESQVNLFESFERVEQEKNRYIEGSGLGLAITKELLEAMNGSMELESEYGVGSIFIVHLPQEIVDDTPMGEFEMKELPLQKESRRMKGITAPQAKVLVVDDSEVNLAVAAALLKQSQVQITLAASGRECLEKMRENTYDLVFIDYHMPDMDGVHTIKALKEEKIQGDAKLIALTGEDIESNYKSFGFHDYIRKPIEPKQLDIILRTYLPKEYLQEEKEDHEDSVWNREYGEIESDETETFNPAD